MTPEMSGLELAERLLLLHLNTAVLHMWGYTENTGSLTTSLTRAVPSCESSSHERYLP